MHLHILSSSFFTSSISPLSPFLLHLSLSFLSCATEDNSITRDVIAWTETFSSAPPPSSPPLFLFPTIAYLSCASLPRASVRNLLSSFSLFLSRASSFRLFLSLRHGFLLSVVPSPPLSLAHAHLEESSRVHVFCHRREMWEKRGEIIKNKIFLSFWAKISKLKNKNLQIKIMISHILIKLRAKILWTWSSFQAL